MQVLTLKGTHHSLVSDGNLTLLVEGTNNAKQNRKQTDILTK